MSEKNMKRIAVIIPCHSPSTWRKIEGIMTFAQTRPEWEVSLVPYEQLSPVKRALRTFKPDGIICARLDEKAMSLVASLSLPTAVAFHPDETKTRPKRVAYVLGDGDKMGRTVARHMYSRGYRSFLLVGRASVSTPSRRRWRSSAAIQRGLQPPFRMKTFSPRSKSFRRVRPYSRRTTLSRRTSSTLRKGRG